MSTGTSKPAPDVLLCERCGYVLSGLPTDAACPECGKAIAESLPSVRTLAYDPKRGMGWVRVAVRMVRSPFGAYSCMHIGAQQAGGFAERSFAVVSALTGFAAALLLFDSRFRAQTLDPDAYAATVLQAIVSGLVVACGTFALLWIIMLIERAGSRTIGAWHRWRITREVAYCVCAYASVGWLMGVLGAMCWGMWYVTRGRDALIARSDEGLYAMNLGLPAVVLLGLFGYELLVYIGLRRCKFANVEGAR